jgi:hypothetical protein
MARRVRAALRLSGVQDVARRERHVPTASGEHKGKGNAAHEARAQLFLDVFAMNGVGTCCTCSLPHFGQGGCAVGCSARCSTCSNVSPHFSQRYW